MSERRTPYVVSTEPKPVDWLAEANVQEKLEALNQALREADAIIGELLILAAHRRAEAADTAALPRVGRGSEGAE